LALGLLPPAEVAELVFVVVSVLDLLTVVLLELLEPSAVVLPLTLVASPPVLAVGLVLPVELVELDFDELRLLPETLLPEFLLVALPPVPPVFVAVAAPPAPPVALAEPEACAHAPPALRARTAQDANKILFILSFLFLSPPLRRTARHACTRPPGSRGGITGRGRLCCRGACRPS
jgi:hypothetical protein